MCAPQRRAPGMFEQSKLQRASNRLQRSLQRTGMITSHTRNEEGCASVAGYLPGALQARCRIRCMHVAGNDKTPVKDTMDPHRGAGTAWDPLRGTAWGPGTSWRQAYSKADDQWIGRALQARHLGTAEQAVASRALP